MPPTTNPHLTARMKRCRDSMVRQKLNALVVTDPVNVRYLTGFSGGESVLLLTPNRKLLVTDSRFVEQVRHECYRLPLLSRKGPMPPAVGQALGRLLKGRRRRRVGIDPASVTAKEHTAYRRAIGQGLIRTDALVSNLRLCKDADEVKQMSRALRVAEDAMRATVRWLKVGMTEFEVAARLDYEMARRGSTAPAFPTITAFGPHAAQPHAVPGRARLRRNQPILFDWGATINGYKSDLTRCYVIGKIPPRFAEAYQWVLEAQLAAIEAVKPGVPLAQVDRQARKAIGRRLPMYGHGTGHGLGLKVHEPPALGPQAAGHLDQGMIVTVEPGAYLPGRFGIRIEDDVLVTARGKRVLSRLAKDLDSVAL